MELVDRYLPARDSLSTRQSTCKDDPLDEKISKGKQELCYKFKLNESYLQVLCVVQRKIESVLK